MPLLALICVLVLVWLVVAIIGAVIEGLFWLLMLGLVLSVPAAAWGWARRNSRR